MKIRWTLTSDDGEHTETVEVDTPAYDANDPTAVRTVTFPVSWSSGFSGDGTLELSYIDSGGGSLSVTAPEVPNLYVTVASGSDPLTWTSEGGDVGHRVVVTDQGGGYFTTTYSYNLTAGGTITYVQRNTSSLVGDALTNSWSTHSSTYNQELPVGNTTGWAAVSLYGDDGDYQVAFRGLDATNAVVSTNMLIDVFEHRTYYAGYSVTDATLAVSGTISSFSDLLYSEMHSLRFSLDGVETEVAKAALTVTNVNSYSNTKDYSFDMGVLTRGQTYVAEIWPTDNEGDSPKFTIGSQLPGVDRTELSMGVSGNINISWMQGYPYLNPTNYNTSATDLGISVVPGNAYAPTSEQASFEVRFSGDCDVTNVINGVLIWITPEAAYGGTDINSTYSYSNWDTLASDIIFGADPAGSRGKVLLYWDTVQPPVNLQGLNVYDTDQYSERIAVNRLPETGDEAAAIAFTGLTAAQQYEVVVVPILGTYLQEPLVWNVTGQSDVSVFPVTIPDDDYSMTLVSSGASPMNGVNPTVQFGADVAGKGLQVVIGDDADPEFPVNNTSYIDPVVLDGSSQIANIQNYPIAWPVDTPYYFRVYESQTFATKYQFTRIDVPWVPYYAAIFAVTVQSGVYYLDGVEASLVTVPEGYVRFDLSDSSCDGHPMLMSETEDGTHSGGVLYSEVTYIVEHDVLSVTTDYLDLSTFNAATRRGVELWTDDSVNSAVHPLYTFSSAQAGMGGLLVTPQYITNTYAFEVAAGNYSYQSVSNPSPSWDRGKWFEITLDSSTADSHPLLFSVTSDGAHSGGVPYNDINVIYYLDGAAVVSTDYVSNFSGADVRKVQVKTPPSGDLYYYCHNHAGMGAEITLT